MIVNIDHISTQAIFIVRQVGGYVRSSFQTVKPQDVEQKSLNSLVTHVDKTAEERLVKGLKNIIGNSVFLVEEETVLPEEGDYQWIIDPLDGTTNFIFGIPIFAISVALVYKGEIQLGIVYDVMQDRCYHAIKGVGSYVDDNPIKVSSRTQLSDCLIATGFPYYDFEHLDKYMHLLKALTNTTTGVRRLGAAAIDLVYIAIGKFDVYFEYSLSPWDVAAGALIVQEAGGVVTDFSRGSNWLYGKEIIATNSNVNEEFMTFFSKHYK
jgi:myo-inositol-1(or 4)-monophosphatase